MSDALNIYFLTLNISLKIANCGVYINFVLYSFNCIVQEIYLCINLAFRVINAMKAPEKKLKEQLGTCSVGCL